MKNNCLKSSSRLIQRQHTCQARSKRARIRRCSFPLAAALGLVLAMAFPAYAQTVTYVPATTIVGDSDVLTEGTLVAAYDLSGTSVTINGVPFTGSTSTTTLGANITPSGVEAYFGGYGIADAPYTSLSSAYQSLLSGGDYHDSGSITLTLGGLTVGHSYAAQMWVNDSRAVTNNTAYRQETIESGVGPNEVTLLYCATATPGGLGQFTTATFIASNTSLTFTLNAMDGTPPSSQINSIQLRDITSVVPVSFGSPTTISGDTDVSSAGSLAYAYNFTGNTVTLNGVPFTGTTSKTILGAADDITLSGFNSQFDGYGSATPPFSSLSSAYQTILSGGDYVDGNLGTITLNNLTVGSRYRVQLWVNDARGALGRNEIVTSIVPGAPSSATLVYNSTQGGGGVGQYVIGTFLATATNQTLLLIGNQSTQLNAIQVRNLDLSLGALTPVSGQNTLPIEITAVGSIEYESFTIPINANNTQTADLTGDQPFTLTGNFDPVTQAGTITGIDFYNGNIQVANTLTWTLNLGTYDIFLQLGTVTIVGSNLLAQIATQDPLSSVSSGSSFALTNEDLNLNGGTLNISASGVAADFVTSSTDNLATDPVEGPIGSNGNGTVSLSSPTITGDTASYTITATFPVDFTYPYEDESGVNVTILVNGITEWQGTFTRLLIPTTPTNLTATPGNNLVSLKWNASTGSPSSYNVLRSTTSGAETLLTNVSSTNYTDTKATNGGKYYYVVNAQNGNGTSENSPEVSATLPAPAPPSIGSIALGETSTTVVLQVSSQTGFNYILESTTNLAPPAVWTPVNTNSGTGGTLTNSVTISAGQSQVYFRYVAE